MGAEEGCDDGNALAGDGCDSACVLEIGFSCAGEPTTCQAICGDGFVRGQETCDEGAAGAGGGCSAGCVPRIGFQCSGEGPGSCRAICGDGRVRGEEACDDGAIVAGDGCGATCAREPGFTCGPGEPTVCGAICGDERTVGDETCDDGNFREGDGCSPECVLRLGWRPIPNRDPPGPRFSAASAWTGREWFIWGGGRSNEGTGELSDGRLYSPASGTWREVNRTGAPTARASAAVAWTGAEILVWGGAGPNSVPFGDGRGYDPTSNTWRLMSQVNAPSARQAATAVWTGTEMIIFGGRGANLTVEAGGAAYNPSTDAWRSLSVEGAPSPRYGHTAVWTGSEVIIFGGWGDQGFVLRDGAAYDPVLDSWRPLGTRNAPSSRAAHSAVWTGTRMIVFGGLSAVPLYDGAAYDPALDFWIPIASRRSSYHHRAVWTGSEMIVFGGWPAGRVAAKYNPALDRWTDLPREDAPVARGEPMFALTEDTLLLLGGWALMDGSTELREVADGGRFDLRSQTWSPIRSGVEIAPRRGHLALRFGSEVLLWGGDNLLGEELRSGARIDVASGVRRALPLLGAPKERLDHAGVVTERELILWGGRKVAMSEVLGDGASYDLVADRWIELPMNGAPSPRAEHTAVFTGTEMIVWGGRKEPESFGDGARFDVEARLWRPMGRGQDSPSPRASHTAIWTGTEMIIWGGRDGPVSFDTGARFDPARDRWTPLSLENAPSRRALHTAVWTGTEMIIWGGRDSERLLNTGARYDPAKDRWAPLSLEGAPSPREYHSATWSGSQMVVFGGDVGLDPGIDEPVSDGARYDAARGAWLPVPRANAPAPRWGHSGVWMGTGLVIWGGSGQDDDAPGEGAILDL